MFCVNILQVEQAHISRAFGGGLKGDARFSVGEWLSGDGGVPYLAGVQANLFCRLDGLMNYGTHKIVIGKVENGMFADDITPLIYQDGCYASTRPTETMAEA